MTDRGRIRAGLKANINVIDMINKSRDDVAYNLIDVEREPQPDLIDALEAIDGVIKVRLL